MAEVFRTPEENFAGLRDFDFAPHWHDWEGLRVHYLDEGPREAPVMLLLHGMPTWSYLYRDVIPPLVAAGFRCIAPDHLGFGKSDKPGDLSWYSIARHTEVLTSLIGALDLREITLVCQDWGGPTGLAQAAMMPERFRRLVIMNTWLHHEGYEYSPGIRGWHSQWMPGGAFDRPQPDVGLLMVASARGRRSIRI
jgi:haloalkane dehalogenase